MNEFSTRLDGFANQLVQLVGEADSQAPNLPDMTTRVGNIFNDATNPVVQWYLPDFALPTENPSFAFDAKQSGVDAAGDPFNEATVTFALRINDPDDVTAARADNPEIAFQPIATYFTSVTLDLVRRAADGSDETLNALAVAEQVDQSSVTVTVSLTGPDVVVAYDNLLQRGVATVTLYTAYTAVTPRADWEKQADGADYKWVTEGVQTTIPIGATFSTDTYRSRYTITADGITRVIIDTNDLKDFARQRSEYRELTSLGQVSQKYPSLRHLFFGQVSGTVVAVPAAYGIVRSSAGTSARCEAVVDDSPGTLSGCRFKFAFTLAPAVDPIDLVRLSADVAAIPEAKNRTLRLALPAGLDPRHPPDLTGLSPADAAVIDGTEPQTLLLTATIADRDTTPAITDVNVFLHELAARTAPLAGQVAVRLDDRYPAPVTTDAVLNLNTTVGTDDITVSGDEDFTSLVVANLGPLDLRLTAVADVGPTTEFGQSPLDIRLATHQTTRVDKPNGGTIMSTPVLRRCLDITPPLAPADLFRYVELHTLTVQSTQHPLSFNATSIDFVAADIRQLDVTVSLRDLPAVRVQPFTLTRDHRIDSVNVQVPVDAALRGLTATVSITVDQTRRIVLDHDFLDQPVMIITV
ncbi:hypothetical protein [Actinocrispum wychmicini]|uniref:hypothetical protein n=1 Tax=Actinocrispum wychmicini TaxID=1213861 RepID=UPI001A9DC833|nr:hypothetical protein [Actinocrispum wychmicini]